MLPKGGCIEDERAAAHAALDGAALGCLAFLCICPVAAGGWEACGREGGRRSAAGRGTTGQLVRLAGSHKQEHALQRWGPCRLQAERPQDPRSQLSHGHSRGSTAGVPGGSRGSATTAGQPAHRAV